MDALDLVDFPDDVAKLKQQMVAVRQDIDFLRKSGDASFKAGVDSARRVDVNWRANLIVQLSTITLMVDAKLVSIEEAASRIEHIQSVFAKSDPAYENPLVLMGYQTRH
jgi:hypothetical protein